MSMTAPSASHAQPIVLCESGKAPEYVQILPAGIFAPNDGRGPWRVDDAKAVIEETKKRLGSVDILIDYNHQSEHAAKNGRPAPAAGWITELEARKEGVFGRVSWTDKGAAAVAAREFRYISPVFNHDQTGKVTRIISCALTNTPALDMLALCERDIKPQTTENDMDPKIVAQALGLPESASEAEIVAACAAARKAQSEAEKAPDPAKFVPIDAHNAALAELASLKKAQCEARASALVADAKAKGKLIPAMEKWAKAYAESDEKGFLAWLEAAPVHNLDKETVTGKPKADEKQAAETRLTDDQKAICEKMGLDEAKYLEEMKKTEAANG